MVGLMQVQIKKKKKVILVYKVAKEMKNVGSFKAILSAALKITEERKKA